MASSFWKAVLLSCKEQNYLILWTLQFNEMKYFNYTCKIFSWKYTINKYFFVFIYGEPMIGKLFKFTVAVLVIIINERDHNAENQGCPAAWVMDIFSVNDNYWAGLFQWWRQPQRNWIIGCDSHNKIFLSLLAQIWLKFGSNLDVFVKKVTDLGDTPLPPFTDKIFSEKGVTDLRGTPSPPPLRTKSAK